MFCKNHIVDKLLKIRVSVLPQVMLEVLTGRRALEVDGQFKNVYLVSQFKLCFNYFIIYSLAVVGDYTPFISYRKI